MIHSAYGMAKVKAYDYAPGMGFFGKILHIQQLCAAIKHRRKQYHRHILRHGGNHIRFFYHTPVTALYNLYRILRVITFQPHLTCDGIAVGWEIQLINEYLIPFTGGVVEGSHALMNVYGGICAYRDFLRVRVYET